MNGEPTLGPSSDEKLWAGLGYAGLICCMIPSIVILFLKKDESDYLKFHLIQAVGFGVAVFIVNMVLWTVLGPIPIINLLPPLIGLALTGYWVYLMVMAFTGKDVEVPVLGEFVRNNLMK